MRKTLVVMLVLGLFGGSLAPPATGAKKEKSRKLFKGKLRFYLHSDESSLMCDSGQYMNLENKSGDVACSFILQAAQDALAAASNGPPGLVWSFPASDGVPFRLKAKEGVGGLLAISHGPIIDGSVHFDLTGVIKKAGLEGEATLVHEELEIGTSPPGTKEFDLGFSLPRNLDGRVFHSLKLEVAVRGVTPSASVAMEDPASHITIHAKRR